MLDRKKRLEDLATEIADMDYSKFTEGEDYASLAKRYSTQGKKAMDDTIGKVAARTGGLASSYATAAGNQAYNDYMGKLEDAARGLYDSQRQEKMEQFNLQKALYDQDYREANDLYERSYRASRDNVSDNQWKQQFDREGEQITDNKTQTMVEDEELDLKTELYYNPNAYPTYADYKAAFPGTLITEAHFNQIKGIATGMYAEDNKVVESVDTGSLSDTDKKIIEQYKWYVENDIEIPTEIHERYKQIMGISTIKGTEYANNIANAKTYAEALKYAEMLSEIDEDAAMEALSAWKEAHPGFDKKTDPNDWKNVMPGHKPNSWNMN